jgi:hypothetical protein
VNLDLGVTILYVVLVSICVLPRIYSFLFIKKTVKFEDDELCLSTYYTWGVLLNSVKRSVPSARFVWLNNDHWCCEMLTIPENQGELLYSRICRLRVCSSSSFFVYQWDVNYHKLSDILFVCAASLLMKSVRSLLKSTGDERKLVERLAFTVQIIQDVFLGVLAYPSCCVLL